MNEKVLFVDDEVNALAGYERNLHRDFQVTTATGGEQALAAIDANGPFSVVVSDMRMPGMNGAEFLAQVRTKAPDTVRMMLTGHSDLDAAILAVNEGKIFRYLTKPCEKAVLVEAVKSCIEQYRTRTGERDLLKKARLVNPSTSSRGVVTSESSDGCDTASPQALSDRAQALRHLASVCGTDPRSLVVLFRLPQYRAIELRYGTEAGTDYIKKEAQFLADTLSPDDWIYRWQCDTLLAILRWPLPAPKTTEALSEFVSKRREHVLTVDEQPIRIKGKMTFDLLPAIEYSDVDELLRAFADREIGLS